MKVDFERMTVPLTEPDEILCELVAWCGRGFDGDTCPFCFATTPDCVPLVEVDGCEHGYDCPWLLVLKFVA